MSESYPKGYKTVEKREIGEVGEKQSPFPTMLNLYKTAVADV